MLYLVYIRIILYTWCNYLELHYSYTTQKYFSDKPEKNVGNQFVLDKIDLFWKVLNRCIKLTNIIYLTYNLTVNNNVIWHLCKTICILFERSQQSTLIRFYIHIWIRYYRHWYIDLYNLAVTSLAKTHRNWRGIVLRYIFKRSNL